MVSPYPPQLLPSKTTSADLNSQHDPVVRGLHHLTTLALKLHLLTTQGANSALQDPACRDLHLARLSAQFDRAYAKAVQLGLTPWREFVVGCAGRSYAVVLTPEGVELCSLTQEHGPSPRLLESAPDDLPSRAPERGLWR